MYSLLPSYEYLINNQIDTLERFDYIELKIFFNKPSHPVSELWLQEILRKLEIYISSIEQISIETYINDIEFFKTTLKGNSLQKSGDFEYSTRFDWKNLFSRDKSAKNLYIKLLESEMLR